MDQRRFLTFLLVSLLVWVAFQSLFAPRQPPNQPPVAGQPGAEVPPVDGKDQEVANDAAVAGELPALAELDAPASLATLGSLNPETGYRMLITVTSVGGAVKRAELSSSQFLDQDDQRGYLGELELTPTEGGLRVQVVGDGTPAEKAGLEVGDVIVAASFGKSELPTINSVVELEKLLAESKQGQQLALEVRRGEEPTQSRTVTLARRPFAVVRPEIENFQMRGNETPPEFVDRPSFLLMLSGLGDKKFEGPDINNIATLLEQKKPIKPLEQQQLEFARRLATLLEQGQWKLSRPNESSVEFTRQIDELGLALVKRYTLTPVPADSRGLENYPGYHLQLDVEIRNTSEEPQIVSYRLDGPTGMPTEGWWYAHKISRHRWFAAAGLRDVVVRFDGLPVAQFDGPKVAEGDVDPMGEGNALAFAGVDGQYFSAILIPGKVAKEDAWIDTTEAIRVGAKLDPAMPATYNNVTCRLTRRAVAIAPGASQTDSFQVFLGPKRPALLSQYQPGGNPNNSLADAVYYGWPIFAAVARAMLSILHFFYGIVGNYGIAIVMLTLLVRGALFPLSWKQTQSMARMQELKPEMDRINEKYKTDVQKRSQEIQALYRKNQINPLGGCLPVLLQMPIFIGLYKGLMVDVELRGSPLLGHAIRWCSNLAAPDMLLDWSWMMPAFINRGEGLFGLGPYFNILPIVTVALFLVTQKMAMPPATNEQAVMQQKMMKYMTIFMGLLFYKVAAGLCIYFIASSLWGIAERKMLKKAKGPAAELVTDASSKPLTAAEKLASRRTSQPGDNGSSDQKKKSKPRRK